MIFIIRESITHAISYVCVFDISEFLMETHYHHLLVHQCHVLAYYISGVKSKRGFIPRHSVYHEKEEIAK